MEKICPYENNDRYADFDGMISRHATLVKQLCVRHATGDAERSAELVQLCYIALWRRRAAYLANERRPDEETWVRLVCRSTLANQRRLDRLHPLLILPSLDHLAVAGPDSPDNPARDYLESLATVLTQRERQAFMLMLEGYSPEEMAAELGILHPSAIVLRHRIFKKLRHHCKDEKNSSEGRPEASKLEKNSNKKL